MLTQACLTTWMRSLAANGTMKLLNWKTFFHTKTNAAVKEKLESIKAHNKRKLARHLKEHQGVEINTNSIFDIQIKRLHEYKRQQMNAFVCHPQILGHQGW